MTGFRLGSGKKEKLSPPAKPTALVDEVSAPQGFGIRNYLHQFYLSPTVEDIEQSGAWYLLPQERSKRGGLFFCRICTVIGLLLLTGGALSIIVGYSWPHDGVEETITKIYIFRDSEGGYYVPYDRLQSLYLDPMRHWKTAGFCVFASGALLLAVSLIVPTLAACFRSKRFAAFASEDNTPHEAIRIFPHSEKTGIASTSGPVPVMEEIAKVQPTEKSPVAQADVLDSSPLLQ